MSRLQTDKECLTFNSWQLLSYTALHEFGCNLLFSLFILCNAACAAVTDAAGPTAVSGSLGPISTGCRWRLTKLRCSLHCHSFILTSSSSSSTITAVQLQLLRTQTQGPWKPIRVQPRSNAPLTVRTVLPVVGLRGWVLSNIFVWKLHIKQKLRNMQPL